MTIPHHLMFLRDDVRWWHKLAFIAVLVFFPLHARTAEAASLNLNPAAKTISIGGEFAVSVVVDSAGQNMNAASGAVSFPSDKLQVVSLSKSGSIFSLWVQEPSFSNAAGTVNFEGIVLNPGFTGSGGKIITINFKSKAAGEANIVFSSGEILANDGKGTNILGKLGGSLIGISPIAGTAVPPSMQSLQPPATALSSLGTGGLAPQPQISSPTHPEQDGWYNNNSPKFTWQVPQGVTAVRLSYDQDAKGSTLVSYSPPISEKLLKDMEDGVWYFHAQFRNSKGWGPVATYRFQIDTMPPQPFKIEIIDGKEITYPRPTILFNTIDDLSGIDHYQVKIGESEIAIVNRDEVKSNPYTLPPQPPGKRTILVKAVDKAGNYVTNVEEVTIKALAKPVVVSYPKSLSPGQNLVIKGTAYPKTRLSLWLIKSDADQPVRHQFYAEEDGTFTFISPQKVENGVYYFWLITINQDQATSEPTEKYTVIVAPTAVYRTLAGITNWLAVLVPLAGLIILLVWMIVYFWKKFREMKGRIRYEAKEAEAALHQGMSILKTNFIGYIKLLEEAKSKRKLTAEENRIVKQLKKDIAGMEEFVSEELEQIIKEVK